MKLARFLTMAALLLCMPLGALADSNVLFNNLDGMFQTSASGGQTFLNLIGSSLSLVNNLGAPFDCPTPPCMGTVSLTTGPLTTGFPSLTANTGFASFGSGGTFSVISTRPGGAFTFSGMFSGATWTKSFVTIAGKAQPFWTFVGTIVDGELMVDGHDFMNIGAATIDLTTVGGHAMDAGGGQLKWEDSSGSTNFPSPVPEPSTLALFGGGLIALGMLTRHKLSAE